MTFVDEASAQAVDEVRAVLRAADYTSSGIAGLGVEPGLGVRAPDVPILLQALRPAEPLATLVRLFLLGQPVAEREFMRHFGPAAAAFAAAGLVVARPESVEPAVGLTPWRDLIVAHDPDPAADLWAEHVSGPTPAGETLIQLVTLTGRSALDLGTGSGLLAAALSRGVDRVTATDVNAAALRFARLTARLSNASNVEVREGSLFEPVEDERFDVIVSNPPFVIGPDSELVFRHNRLPRDEMARDVVRGAAEHLADGGWGYALVNWIHDPGQPWLAGLEPWLEGLGCDALCLLQGIEDPLAYTVRWNAREQQLRPDRYPVTLERWLEHFRSERIEAIASGAIVLRKRSGRIWTHGLELAAPGRGDASAQVRRIFSGLDALDEHGDQPVLRDAYRLPAAHRLNQALVARDGEYVVEPAVLVPDEGLALSVRVEPDLLPVILRLDGTQRLDEIVQEVADGTGADRPTLQSRATALVRDLLERGFAERVRRGA